MEGPVGSSVPTFTQSDFDILFDFKCSPEQNSSFLKEYSEADVKEAFFSMPKNKTGGLDGYSAEIFTSTWSVIGPEITEAVLEFFKSGCLLKQWNAANLVLIPKKPNASTPTDFRPISCLNTTYKVISKMLASRLKAILPLMISKLQSAFLPGRLLAENVLLATDLVNGYNSQSLSPRGMLKVDLRKAFDCLRWDFILASLRALDVPENFIMLISECLSTCSFSVSINGSAGGFFKSTKGIRQGDPLSPYLFVLAMECLSRLLKHRYEIGDIGYHPGTHDLKISHFMFADDVMVFFDGTSNSLHGISECLDDVASWSGLHMNTNKTELFTSGTDQTETTAIACYGFKSVQFPIRYLGLPLMCRKLKISEYAPLMTKLNSRFQSWSAKLLSFAGRLQLLKMVIFGTVNFWLSAFILPKGCIRFIEALCYKFLWSGSIVKKSIAKIAWPTVCLPKEEGGLGLRSFMIWNQVLCLKFIWILLSKSPSLWVDWHRSTHLQDKSFWTITASASDSWTWRKLLELRPLALQFIRSRVGNGRETSFWYDVWTPLGQLINHIGPAGPRALRIRKDAVVADVVTGSSWTLPHPRSQREVDLHVHLTTISLPLPVDAVDEYDDWVAGDTALSVFWSSATWETLRPREEEKDWCDVVWFKGAVPKLAFTMWITNYDRLPTRSRLASWGMLISPACPLCTCQDETRDHLILSCQYSQDVWRPVLRKCQSPTAVITNWSELLSWIRTPTSSLLLLRKIATQSVIYHIWKQRNNLVHNQVLVPAVTVFRDIDRKIKNIISAQRSRKKFRSIMPLWMS